MKHVHSEITYVRQSDNCNVHSDCCPPDCSRDNMSDEQWRKFLHDILDEWINNSEGASFFYIEDPEALNDNFNEVKL